MVVSEENELKLVFSINFVREVRLLSIHQVNSPIPWWFGKSLGSPMKEAGGGVAEITLHFLLCSLLQS